MYAAPPHPLEQSNQACMQEEIEELFVSVRDLILSRPDGDVAEVKWLLDHLPSAQQQGGQAAAAASGQHRATHTGMGSTMGCRFAWPTAFWRQNLR